MDKDKFYKKDGVNIFRVDKIANRKIETTYIHLDYKLETPDNGVSETGLLTVFTLEPTKQKQPIFTARWDQNYETLDIDILGVDKNTSNLFKKEKNGYCGHHPKIISQVTRTYAVCIKIPDKDIFSGNITFNINHGHSPDLFKHLFGLV